MAYFSFDCCVTVLIVAVCNLLIIARSSCCFQLPSSKLCSWLALFHLASAFPSFQSYVGRKMVWQLNGTQKFCISCNKTDAVKRQNVATHFLVMRTLFTPPIPTSSAGIQSNRVCSCEPTIVSVVYEEQP